MNKTKFSRYNDGSVKIYREKERFSDFSAKQNVDVMDDLDFVCRLDFEELSKREQDLEFAEQNDFSLSLKIKTRYVKGIDKQMKAMIDGYLYDISYIDKSKTELFLYLEGVKPIDSEDN